MRFKNEIYRLLNNKPSMKKFLELNAIRRVGKILGLIALLLWALALGNTVILLLATLGLLTYATYLSTKAFIDVVYDTESSKDIGRLDRELRDEISYLG